MEFKAFALELSSINDYENVVEQLNKIGYKEVGEWNEHVLYNKMITWGLNSFLVCIGDSEIQLHNHEGCQDTIDERYCIFSLTKKPFNDLGLKIESNTSIKQKEDFIKEKLGFKKITINKIK